MNKDKTIFWWPRRVYCCSTIVHCGTLWLSVVNVPFVRFLRPLMLGMQAAEQLFVHLNCCLNYVVCYLETYFALNTYLNFVLLYGSIHVQHYYMTSVFVSHFYLTSPKLLIDFYLLITRLSFFSDNLSSVHLFQDVTLLHDQPAFLGHQQLYAYCRPNPRAKYLHYRLAGEPTVQLYHLVPKFHRQLLVNANQTTNSLYELCKLQVT